MSDKPVPKNRPVPGVRFVDPDGGTPYLYSNWAQVVPTMFDTRIMFGEVIGATSDSVVVQRRASITLSWLEAKILRDLLSRQIELHETNNGEIKMSPEMISSGPARPEDPPEDQQEQA